MTEAAFKARWQRIRLRSGRYRRTYDKYDADGMVRRSWNGCGTNVALEGAGRKLV
jgi:hypothetical protein